LFFDYVKKEAKVDNLKKKPCLCYYGTDLKRSRACKRIWHE